ncbi:MAG TPA: MopE-related protein [Polyangiales bacterium]
MRFTTRFKSRPFCTHLFSPDARTRQSQRSSLLLLMAAVVWALTAAATPALAQVKPRFVLGIDTSGSMHWDVAGSPTYGDGVGRPASAAEIAAGTNVKDGVFYGCGTSAGIDRDCNGLPDDSRISIGKAAIRDMLSAFGDVDWSLARFHMTQALNNGTKCTVYGGEACNAGNNSQALGNPQCNTGVVDNMGCLTPAGDAIPASCQPGVAPNADMKVWATGNFPGCINYAGGCLAGGDILVGFPGFAPFVNIGNEYAIYKWVDNVETNATAATLAITTTGNFCDHAGAGDCELRSDGATPIGNLLNAINGYVNPIKMAEPAATAACRGYYVIVLTDGAETCSSNPNGAAATMLTNGIKTYVVGLAVAAADQANLNAIAAAGGTTSAYFPNSKAELSAALSSIVAASIKTEVCNGVDDNCNGQIDEGFTLYCNKPAGVNTATLCMKPAETKCDGIDDNCDGQIDEGLLNACGSCPGAVEICDGLDNDCNGYVDDANGNKVAGSVCNCVPEQCNNIDDNCNGQIDEGLNRACGSSVGTCVAGNQVCTAGAWGTCTGGTGPGTETCNGLDDNCNGSVDEGTSQSCGTSNIGTCQFGTRLCVGGVLQACTGNIDPTTETCDGKDNNCDGVVDNGNPGGGGVCGSNVGICKQGTLNCVSGALVCQGGTGPATETCNNIDDDCNGVIDNGNPGGGTVCGSNVGACKQGSTLCVAGADVCQGATAATAEICNGIDDDCNGIIDNGNPGGGAACGSNTGTCKKGVLTCTAGALSCVGATGPTAETCDGLDNDCDGVIDNGNPGGGAVCGSNVGACKQGTTLCVAGAYVCQGSIAPVTETCNSIDDNCDGTVDNGNPGGGATCGSSVGTCKTGTVQCTAGALVCTGSTGPATETCNGLDDNCNGVIDDGNPGGGAICGSNVGTCKQGTQLCVNGAYVCSGSVGPATESCNALDDDCNGTVDNGNPGGGGACGSNVGVCKTGTVQCTAGALTCTGAVNASAETCDNLDNNCNGVIDDGNPGGGAVCGVTKGACKAGTTLCVAGAYVCQGEITPSAELCNGIDDDCNGTVDNGNPGGGGACGTSVGECNPGTLTCSGGTLSCVGGIAAVPEVCDGKDNNCDGVIDDGNPGGGMSCGSSVGTCKTGSTVCLNGAFLCSGATGPTTEVCDGLDNDCNGTVDNSNPGGGGVCGSNVGTCKQGVLACQAGNLNCTGAVNPVAETCDAKDNDCDGVIDNGNPGGGAVCGSNVGECKQGAQLCVNGAFVCSGGVNATGEVCNGKDDDCNGVIDNGNPGGGGICGSAVGECKTGLVQCTAGALSCVGGKGPTAEICNGKDDDCDGIIDNGNPGGGAVCGSNVGECKQGTSACVKGAIVCSGAIAAMPELCNGKDDDCNGTIDDGNPQGGAACGSSIGVCVPGALQCVSGALTCVGGTVPSPELCNNLDDNCNGQIDDGNPGGGGSCGMTKGECRAGMLTCLKGSFICQGGITPQNEICDNKDNDCDGAIDNGNPGGGLACGIATGECKKGTTTCTAGVLVCNGNVDPQPAELCNGKDDNCNGQIDEGNPQGGAACGEDINGVSLNIMNCPIGDTTKPCGQCEFGAQQCKSAKLVCVGATGPQPERCDGIDNDCDGVIDNGVDITDPNLNQPCGPVALGVCTMGTSICTGGNVTCQGGKGPTAEVCNGLDDDCDGVVDDGIPIGAPCGTDVGECSPGNQVCDVNTGKLVCVNAIGPTPELCDGLDNDCNGLVDDHLGLGTACGSGVGECKPGMEACSKGAVVCVNDVPPTPEVCDCKDNNCNGQADEVAAGGSLCGSTGKCIQCQCALPCATGSEFNIPCPTGKAPITDNGKCYCVGEVCKAADCAGQTIKKNGLTECTPGSQDMGACVCKNNVCTFGCDGVICANGTVCNPLDGTCQRQTCLLPQFRCKTGDLCNPMTGACEADPCASVSCKTGEACRDGKCFKSCATANCTAGMLCVDGSCKTDPCLGKSCTGGKVCNPADGKCVTPSTCNATSCGAGFVCTVATGCESDPCLRTTCPAKQVCKDAQCQLRCTPPLLDCGGTCVDPTQDPEFCGASMDCSGNHAGVACKTGEVCSQGKCASKCAAGTVACAGSCIDPKTDSKHCGATGDCSAGNAGLACDTGYACSAGTCKPVLVSNVDGGVGSAGGLQGGATGTGTASDAPDTKRRVLATGGGGCACSVPAGHAAQPSGRLPWAVAFGLLGMVWLRARRRVLGVSAAFALRARALASIGLLLALLVLGGCKVQPFCLDCVEDGGRKPSGADGGFAGFAGTGGTRVDGGINIGTGTGDAGPLKHDAGADAGPGVLCSQRVELCNHKDDNCNGKVDEGIDTTKDPNNCGACGTACRPDHALGACVSSKCTFTQCDVGFYDLDQDKKNGCEYACQAVPAADDSVCDLRDNDCDGKVDEDVHLDTDPMNCGSCGLSCRASHAANGTTCVAGKCSLDPTKCDAGFYDVNGDPADGCEYRCTPIGGVGPELCDGIDNDCNGLIDENGATTDPKIGQACGNSTGACIAGVTACSSGAVVCTNGVAPTTEVCDGIDNDCNGMTDESDPKIGPCGLTQGTCAAGTNVCVAGNLVCKNAVLPVPELCDGLDNDCDGVIDNGNPEANVPCGNNSTGQCKLGLTVCSGGVLLCVGQVGPTDEVCNGKDDNCDGVVDDANPGGGAGCGNSLGQCQPGTITCVNGALACAGGTNPTPEICDGLDNNCDGQFDEGNPGGGASCGSAVGECKPGTQTCVAGNIVCLNVVTASPEVCDGKDNDCDGVVDNGNPGGGGTCGTNVGECSTGTIQCTNGALVCTGAVNGTVEICDGKDNNCNGQFDEGNPGGGAACGSSNGECKQGAQTCVSGALVCVGQTKPGTEVCDGKDNDCDGVVDNGNPGGGGACGSAVGECKTGLVMCTAGALVCTGGTGPTTEVCDGKDNNCNGQFDEGNPGGGALCGSAVGECKQGTQTCTSGAIACVGGTGPTTEVCDGKDNDCDGTVDNGNPGGGGACGSSVGECKQGTVQCTAGALVCTGATGPATEICDGKDNNCNGIFDEGNPGGGAVCGSSVGACKTGTLTCTSGQFVCAGAVVATTETCNGIDDDCDGTVDNGNPGGGAVCGSSVGQCKTGTIQCTAGALVCAGATGPATEVCDAKDNNCNGQFDEGNPGGGAVCGSAVGTCKQGTMTCTGGSVVCTGSTGPATEICDGKDNDCDGVVDNGNPGGGATCGSNVGQCKTGTIQCTAGALVCTGATTGTAEVCDGKDNDCDGVIDNGNPGGGALCGSNVGTCKQGTMACVAGAVVCQGSVGAVPEICDGKDNDCNGTVDNGNPGAGAACGSDVGQCVKGMTTCTAGVLACTGGTGPATEICDGKDNNCDGQFDENNPGGGATCGSNVGTCKQGVNTCVSGAISCVGQVVATTEVCDGKDNDCNGTIDNGNPGGGVICGSDVGQCKTGLTVCTAGAVVCTGATGPTAEVCDGKDNNCDGQFDEGNPGGGALCGSAVGTCKQGTITCTSGTLACVGSIGPVAEICDGLDNDCNGTADQTFTFATDVNHCGNCSTVCTVANGVPKCSTGTCSIGSCNTGFVDANHTYSDGCELPCTVTGPEVCDGKDNDCNGTIDDSPQLPAPSFCGSNIGVCKSGTPTCTAGAIQCVGTIAASAEVCDGLDNDCNGTVDNGFGLGAACSVGIGACKIAGSIICNGTAATKCSVSVAGTPGNETCNGKDDDCDGQTDEVAANPAAYPDNNTVGMDDFKTVDIGGGVKVFQYEASRPDATNTASGSGSKLACSTGNKIPWTDVTWNQAHDSCCALNPNGQCTGAGGWRLCDSPTWQTACQSSTPPCKYGYGVGCNTANGTTSAAQECNGKEYDSDPSTAGDQDSRLATGAFANCRSTWGVANDASDDIYDMTGNVKEWTNTQQGNGLFELRGGSYNNIEPGRTCTFNFAVGDQAFQFANAGFRCCNYPAAVQTCASYTSTNVPQTLAGGAYSGTVASTLSVAAAGTITDVNVVGVTGTSARFGEDQITLQSPTGTTQTLVAAAACGNTTNANWSFSLDDQAAAGAASCTSPIGNAATVQPTNASFGGQALSGFNGADGTGTWTLRVIDAVGDICKTYSNNTAVVANSNTGTWNSTVTVPAADFPGVVTDVNITTVGLIPSFSELQFQVISPAATNISVIPAGKCGTTSNWNITLDDQAPNTAVTCGTAASSPVGSVPAASNHIFEPANATFAGAKLSGFNGQAPNGNWTLRVIDNVSASGSAGRPTISSWTLTLCAKSAIPTITGWGLQMCYMN